MSLPLLGGGSGHGSGGGGVGGFGPTSLSGLIGWWDASVFGSMTIVTGNITAITDQSGTGNTLSTRFNPPAYSATGLNSLPAMVFGATTTALGNASFAMGTGSTLTFFYVTKMNSATTFFGRVLSYAISPGDDHSQNTTWYSCRDSNTNNILYARNASSVTASVGTTTPRRVIGTIDSSGVMKIYIDGVATTGSTLLTSFGSPGQLAMGLTAYDSSGQYDGAISEAGIATGFTNSTDVASLDTYLKNKWGL